jgi:hypothetical protein
LLSRHAREKIRIDPRFRLCPSDISIEKMIEAHERFAGWP